MRKENIRRRDDARRLNKFTFKGRDVRVIEIDGAPWWVGADVCASIGLPVTGRSGRHYARLADDEKRKVPRKHLGLPPGRPMVLISESGLYKLIMRSDKPEAREFQDWVTREVLPAIRRGCQLGRTLGDRNHSLSRPR